MCLDKPKFGGPGKKKQSCVTKASRRLAGSAAGAAAAAAGAAAATAGGIHLAAEAGESAAGEAAAAAAGEAACASGSGGAAVLWEQPAPRGAETALLHPDKRQTWRNGAMQCDFCEGAMLGGASKRAVQAVARLAAFSSRATR